MQALHAMNWADYFVLGVVALSMVIGLWRGLVSEVMALVIWIAAFWVAWAFGASVSAQFRGLIELPSARVLAGYGLCFIVVLLLGALVRYLISRLVESTGLTGTDRLLGMMFGVLRGMLVVILLVFVLGFTPFSRDPWWKQSVLIARGQVGADWLVQRLPDDVKKYFNKNDAPDMRVPARLKHAIGTGLAKGRQALREIPAAAASTSPRTLSPVASGASDSNTP
jgi:membrane protein required for colicin V production